MTQTQFENKITDSWLLAQLRKALRSTGNGQKTSLYIDMNTGDTMTLNASSHYREKHLYEIFTVEWFLGEKCPTATGLLSFSGEGYKQRMNEIKSDWYNGL